MINIRLLLLVVLGVLVGCADPFIYYRRDVSLGQYLKDTEECEYESARYASLVSDGNVLYRIRNFCMSERDYTLTDRENRGRPWNRKDVEKWIAVERAKQPPFNIEDARMRIKDLQRKLAEESK